MKLLGKPTDWQTIAAEMKNGVQLIRNLCLLDTQSLSEEIISDIQAFIELEDFDPKAINKEDGFMAQALYDWVQSVYQNFCRLLAINDSGEHLQVLDQEQRDLDQAEESAKKEIQEKKE